MQVPGTSQDPADARSVGAAGRGGDRQGAEALPSDEKAQTAETALGELSRAEARLCAALGDIEAEPMNPR